MSKTVLVAGASGLVGFAAMRAFAKEPGTKVIAVSRRKPVELYGATWVQADLTDEAACARIFSEMPDVTHLVFAALFEKPELIAGWVDPEQIETNGRMLKNLFEPLRKVAKGLDHVILLQGTKAYGAHVRPLEVPARPDRDEAKDVPNFYWVQEDYLRGLQAAANWALTIMRPQIIFGVAVGAAMNPVPAIATYGAILKQAGEKLHFPGGKAPWLFEGVHADLVANAIVWSTNERRARGKSYNLTNGDVMVWRNVWPAVADELGMEVGEDRPLYLEQEMPGREAEWQKIVAAHGLRAPDLKSFVGLSYQYVDMQMAPSRNEISGLPVIVSTTNLRQDGFHEVWDSEEMLRDCIRQFRELKLLPPR